MFYANNNDIHNTGCEDTILLRDKQETNVKTYNYFFFHTFIMELLPLFAHIK